MSLTKGNYINESKSTTYSIQQIKSELMNLFLPHSDMTQTKMHNNPAWIKV